MMRDFFKYHSLGNDFVIIDWFKKSESCLRSILQHDDWKIWVVRVCARHTGVGGDGVLVIHSNSEDGMPEILVFNADGSQGQTCLNGLRAVTHYLVVHRGLPASLTIKMGQRLYICEVTKGRGDESSRLVTTAMQPPQLEEPLSLVVEQETFEGFRVSVGNPHFIVMRSIDLQFLQHFGPRIESHVAFPHRTNVEFVWQDCHRDDLFHLFVYERGCGITQACSSGAAATLWLLFSRGFVKADSKISIAMLGGNVIAWVGSDKLWLQAESVEVFSGALAQGVHIQ